MPRVRSDVTRSVFSTILRIYQIGNLHGVTICRELRHSDQITKSEHGETDRVAFRPLSYACDFCFGIGIAHGFATLGTIGFEGRFDYAAIGTVSNVASRLCDEAKPGQILISPRVLMAVEDAVTVEPVGEFALKGIRRPLAAYNVLATNPAN